jgi:hypothetical protein
MNRPLENFFRVQEFRKKEKKSFSAQRFLSIAFQIKIWRRGNAIQISAPRKGRVSLMKTFRPAEQWNAPAYRQCMRKSASLDRSQVMDMIGCCSDRGRFIEAKTMSK